MADSGLTLADFQELDPATGQPVAQKTAPAASNQSVDLRGIAPDMTTQDPDMFAALTAHRARQTMELPTGDALNEVYSKALEAANQYHRDLAQQQERSTLELQARAKAVTSGLLSAEETTKGTAAQQVKQAGEIWELTPQTNLGGESPLTLKGKQEAGVDVIKQNQLAQDKEGPEATAEAKRLGIYGQSVLKAPDEKLVTQLEGLENGYSKLNDLQDLHRQATNTAAFGGFLKSTLGGLVTQPGIISEQVKNYNAAQHAAITPLAIGLLGDTARAATMPGQQENMLHNIIPDANDNLQQAGNKIFMMKRNMIQQLQSIYDNNQGKVAMTRVSDLLAKFHSDFDSDAVQQYNPYSTKNQPLVSYGGLPSGQQQVATAASSGVQVPALPQVQLPQVTPSPGNIPIPQQGAAPQQGATGTW